MDSFQLLVALSAALTGFVDNLKPALKQAAGENENLYQLSVYVVRFAAAMVGVLALGRDVNILSNLPAFQHVSYEFVVLLSTLCVTLGSDFINGVRDFLYVKKNTASQSIEVSSQGQVDVKAELSTTSPAGTTTVTTTESKPQVFG